MLIGSDRITLNWLERVYRGATPTLSPRLKQAVDRSRMIVAQAADSDRPIYGVNTGFGKLATVRIDKAETMQLQRNLILSHCGGIGQPLPDAVTRLAMILKMMSLSKGASGVRWRLIEFIGEMVHRDVLPVVPEKGSVGASGDLAPLAHIAAVMIGEGKAHRGGKIMSGQSALRSVGLTPLEFEAKEGLALINGTQISTALALAGLFEAWRGLVSSITTGALSTDAAMGSSTPFRDEIHALRGHRGQIDIGRSLRLLLKDSEIRESHREGDERVQDPYCLRCQPQVAGAALDILRQAGRTLCQEAEAVTDNPLVLNDATLISGGNFHGEPIGFAADQIAMAIAETGAIAQRRVALLVDPALSSGLPAFLSPAPGLNSGYMILDIASAALAAENKALANPRVVDSLPTSANQEDHVAMSCHAARRLLEMSENLYQIVGIEALCAAQGVEFREPLRTSKPLLGVLNRIRAAVPRLCEDRYIRPELQAAAELVKTGQLLPTTDLQLEDRP